MIFPLDVTSTSLLAWIEIFPSVKAISLSTWEIVRAPLVFSRNMVPSLSIMMVPPVFVILTLPVWLTRIDAFLVTMVVSSPLAIWTPESPCASKTIPSLVRST